MSRRETFATALLICVLGAMVTNTDAAADAPTGSKAVVVDTGGVSPETAPPVWDVVRIPHKGVRKVNTHIAAKPIVLGSHALYYRGRAFAPSKAPYSVKQVIWSGNRIQSLPYVWGGGHGSWIASGYDCSGSVSYVLHGAHLLRTTMTSGDLESWGTAGHGRWITVYASGGHTYLTVAGLRFDTSGADPSRWQDLRSSNGGYVVRHPKQY